ncbi:MAG: hypothetical protein WKF67_13075 [Rubrobacteraceae bacterium]
MNEGASPIFGVPGYAVKVEPSVGGMVLTRADGTSVCIFEASTPEAAIKRIAAQDAKVQSLWRETLAHLLVDLAQYVDYKAALEGELAVLRRLVHGGAIAEAFGGTQRGRGRGR